MCVEQVERWKAEMPAESEMEPRDKYTVFDRNARRYRKGIHSESHLHPLAAWKGVELGWVGLGGCRARGM